MIIVQCVVQVCTCITWETANNLLLYSISMFSLCFTVWILHPTDPNVDVIYISPVPVNEEMMQYYAKLLGLKGAIESGHVEDQADLSNRYKIIVPEAVQSFPVSGFIGIINRKNLPSFETLKMSNTTISS